MQLTKYKLGELIDVRRGASLAGEYYATEGELMRLTLGHFDYQGGGFKDNTSKDDLYFTRPVKPEFILNKGDIITPLTEQTPGLLGSTAMIPESGKYIQSQDVALITPDETKLDRSFCYYLLPSKIVKQQLAAGAQQTKIRHTTPDRIKDLTVFIPDLPNQKVIGKLLRDIDRKIALNREINRNLEAMARQLYDYWFVQFDFPDENGKPYKSSGGKMVFNESLGFDIPLDWDVKRLDDYIESNNTGDWGYDEPSENRIAVGCVRGADIVKLNDIPLRYVKKSNTHKLLNPYDIVIEVSGGSPVQATGRCAYITPGVIERNYGRMTCSNFCHAFRLKNIEASAYFYFLWKSLYENDIMFNFEGKTSGIKNFMTETFLANKWYFAPKDIQKLFFDRVSNIYGIIDSNVNEINLLVKQRDELLPLLMNGQVSVMHREVNCDLSELGR